jgi:Spy/CpxP family protein refolding chaperone
MFRRRKALILVLLWMLMATAAPAQMMPMPGGGPHGGETGPNEGQGMHEGMGMHEGIGMHEGMGMDGGMKGMMKMMMALAHLDLTPDQWKKIQTLRIQHQKEAIPLFAKVRMAGVEIEELMMADPVNMEKVKAKTKEKYASMADLEISHLTLEQKIKAVLTPEQRQQLQGMEMKMGHGGSRMGDSGYPSKHPMPSTNAPADR